MATSPVYQFLEMVPVHCWIELALVLFILYILGCKRTYNPSKRGHGSRGPEELTEEEIDELVDDWKPEALVPSALTNVTDVDYVTLKSFAPDGKHVTLTAGGPAVLNASSLNFLGFASNAEVKDAGRETLLTFSLGSCGPRGFYGTTTKHLELEASLAKFFGVAEAICYSDASSAVSSAIPAFCKRGDLLVVDEGCNHIVRTGCNLSRSSILWFKHNDMADLERVLQSVVNKDKRDDRSLTQRRYVVVEGMYADTGRIAPLPRVVELKKQYKFRLIVDESLSFGVLGASGRGLTEYYNVPPADVEVLLGSNEASLASVGGFCVGTREVIDHQRLSAAGYCFSASAPPFTCSMAMKSLEIMQTRPAVLSTLRNNAIAMHAKIASLPNVDVISVAESPVCHFAPRSFASTLIGDRAAQLAAIRRITDKLLSEGVLVSRKRDSMKESCRTLPTVRIAVTALFTDADIARIAAAVASAVADSAAAGSKGSRAAVAAAAVSAPVPSSSEEEEEDEEAEEAEKEAPARRARKQTNKPPVSPTVSKRSLRSSTPSRRRSSSRK